MLICNADFCCVGVCKVGPELVQKWVLKTVKNGPRVWAFCKIEFPGIQKPVQILTQKSGFFKKCGNRGVGVIWLVWWGYFNYLFFLGLLFVFWLCRLWYGLLFCFVAFFCRGEVGLILVIVFLLGC